MTVVRRRRYRKRLKASERRELVLDAALTLITRTGVFRVTMADVAAESGVTKPVVYDYFANADQLLAALIKRQGMRALEVMAEVLPEPSSLPARGDRLSTLVDRLGLFLRAVQDDPNLWRLTLVPPDGTAPAIRARIEMEREIARQRIQRLLVWAIPGGGGALDFELMSHAIHAMAQRFAREIILKPQEYTPERVMKLARRLLKLARL